jgi:hypothetical protein
MAWPVQGTHMASRLVVLIFPPLSPTVPAHGRRTRCGWAWTAPGFVKIGSRCFRFLLFCDFAFLYLIPSYVDCQSCSIVWPIMPGWPPRFAALRRGGASACADLGHGHSQGGGGSHPRAMRASPPSPLSPFLSSTDVAAQQPAVAATATRRSLSRPLPREHLPLPLSRCGLVRMGPGHAVAGTGQKHGLEAARPHLPPSPFLLL